MRILPINEIITSTLSATNEDANYPVSNVNHVFVKKIFKATQNTSVITSTFGSLKDIDCCYLAYTNSSTAILKLYDASDILLATKTVNLQTNGGIFKVVTGVKYITLTLTATENVYLGTIGIGETYKMPNPDNNIIKGKIDNSITYQSSDGQFAINKIPWLISFPLSFTIFTMDLYNEIYGIFANISRPVWVDVYEELKNGLNPFCAKLEYSEDSQTNRKYTFKIQCTEVR